MLTYTFNIFPYTLIPIHIYLYLKILPKIRHAYPFIGHLVVFQHQTNNQQLNSYFLHKCTNVNIQLLITKQVIVKHVSILPKPGYYKEISNQN